MKTIKILIPAFLILIVNYTSAQVCTQNNRFSNVDFFSSEQIEVLKDLTYGNAVNSKGVSEALKMDIYFPNKDEDTMTKRPFILLIHGGGFTGGHRTHMEYYCQEFAKRGFVVATMSYRLGINQAIPNDNTKAVYRAQQDTNTALHYMVEQAERFAIDPDWVFIGGTSAGAITSMITIYGSQEEWNRAFPEYESSLGPLNTTDSTLNQAYSIKGIYNSMGAISPLVFNKDELIPTISFHGELDKIVPIDRSFIGLGSRAIHKILNEEGICNDFTIVPKGGHGIHRSYEGAQFRIDRISCFFKRLMCGDCSSSFATEDVAAQCSNG